MEEQAREKWLELSMRDWIETLNDKFNIAKSDFDSKFYELEKMSETITLSEIKQKVEPNIFGPNFNIYTQTFEEMQIDTKYIYLNSDYFYNSGIWIGDDRNCISVAKKIKDEIDKGNKSEDVRKIKSMLAHLETLQILHLFVKKISEDKYVTIEGQHRLIAFVINGLEKVKVWASS